MKKKLKKFNSGTNYLQPAYNTEIQQKKLNNAGTVTGALAATAGTVGQGLQSTSANSAGGVNTGKYIAGGIGKGASQGAAIGSVAGPYGILIGSAVGAVAGGVSSATQAKKINNLAAQTRKNNQALRVQQGYAATETEQVFMAKKGLDMTKKKLKKYPGGSASITPQKKQVDPTLPVFTSAENAQLKGLVGTPVYKEAVRTAIGYQPKYVNPRPGSTQATYETNAYNQAVGTFNKRDTLTAPAVDFSPFQAQQTQMAQSQMANYNSGNQKLDQHLMNQGAYVPTPGAMPNPLRRNTSSYAGGTKGIKGTRGAQPQAKLADESKIALTPEERSALPPAGTPEHRQAIQQLLGYVPKVYPAGSQGYLNQERMFNSAVAEVNQGFRPTTSPSGLKGYTKIYNKGTKAVKPIEVEKDEIIMEKANNGKFKVVADFKGGKTHEDGGEPVLATEGQVIFPAKDRGKVVDAIQEGNHRKLERIRKSLPKDTNPKMAKGTKKVDRDKTDPVSVTSKELQSVGGGYTPTQLRKINSVKTGGNYSKNSNGSNIDVAGVAGTIGEIAPIAYNLGQGIFGKVQQTNRRNFNPTGIQYTDNSQPLRNEINSLYNQDKQSIRNLAGGNSAVALANIGRASAGKFKRLQEVNNAEAARKVNTQNANTDLQNNAQLTNLQLNNQYDEMDLANAARKQDFLAAGLGQASQFAQTKALGRNLKKRDEQIIDNLETSNYKIVNGKVQKKKNGTSGIKLKHKMKKC